jgi:hypothetical protein
LIVISGALVLVAAVLLVLGIITSITLVYAAIGLSIVSAVFLLVGVFQRPVPTGEPRESESDARRRQAVRREDGDSVDSPDRAGAISKEPVTQAKEPEPEPLDDIHLVDDPSEPSEAAAEFPLEKANADFEARSAATGADVLVISGRPRYHMGGCAYVDGNDDSEPLELNEARELGFTPCGSCRPNETLALSASGRESAPASPKPTPSPSAPVLASFEPAPVKVAAAAQAAATTSAVPVAPVAPVTEPQQNHVVASQPVAPAEPPAPAVAPEPPAPAVAPEPPEPPEPPVVSRAARATRTVRAVASTKEYHRPDCEMLVGAGAEEITKVAAIRQGFLACGVCKP